MFDQAFTSFKGLISSSFGGDYRLFDLDAGCHFALAEIDLYLRLKKIPHRWAPDLPLHPDASLLAMGGDHYTFLDFRRNAADGLYVHQKTAYGILLVGEDKSNPRFVFHLVQNKTGDPRAWPQTVALAAARSEGELTAFLRELGAWGTERQKLRARGKVNVVWRGELRRDRDLGWDKVLLPPELLDDIRRNVTSFFARPEFFREHGLAHKRGFLFAGRPGNGKTLLCRVIASQCPVAFISLAGKDEDMGHELQSAFHEARQLAPAVLCIEDLDRLFESDGAKSNMGEFLNLMDGMVQSEGMLVLATTNRPEKIDPALTSRPSRFDRVWLIPDPAPAERNRMIERHLGACLAPSVIADLTRATEGMSMAFVQELCTGSALLALDRGLPSPTAAEAEATLARLKAHLEAARNHFGAPLSVAERGGEKALSA